MKTYAPKSKSKPLNKDRPAQRHVIAGHDASAPSARHDRRPEAARQVAAQAMADRSSQVQRMADLQAMADNSPHVRAQAALQRVADKRRENQTGMPDRLKSGLEQLSGMDLSDVRVHRNSAKPAQLNALAYAQGQDIHLGSGQEQHLPHEGWHVVQQMQGRVRPTAQAKGVAINDDGGLEREADVMGGKVLHEQTSCGAPARTFNHKKSSIGHQEAKRVLQARIAIRNHELDVTEIRNRFVQDGQELDPIRVGILTRWHEQQTLHNFLERGGNTALHNLRQALQRAVGMHHQGPVDQDGNPPAFALPLLFGAGNFQFQTQENNRLPTLYFSGGGLTGRLRQQHPTGPLAKIDHNQKERKSFPTVLDRQNFRNAADVARPNGALPAEGLTAGNSPPLAGQHLLEFDRDANGIPQHFHLSGGVVVYAAHYTEAQINEIYAKIIGHQ